MHSRKGKGNRSWTSRLRNHSTPRRVCIHQNQTFSLPSKKMPLKADLFQLPTHTEVGEDSPERQVKNKLKALYMSSARKSVKLTNFSRDPSDAGTTRLPAVRQLQLKTKLRARQRATASQGISSYPVSPGARHLKLWRS